MMRPLGRRIGKRVGGLILAWAPLLAPVAAAAPDLPAALDLAADAGRAARAGGPLIVLFSRNDCHWCDAVKRNYLQPLASHPHYRDRVVIRRIDQDSDQPLVDFKGAATSHARFAASERIKRVPVVAFYGPDGRKLAEPIVGARLPDFYQSYLEEAVDQSARTLQKP